MRESFFWAFGNRPLTCVDSPDAPAAFEELFLYACPKFVSANGPPYDDGDAIEKLILASSGDHESSTTITTTTSSSTTAATAPVTTTTTLPQTITDCTRRHLDLFLADISAQLPVPTLRSFLKLYTSLGTKKLANFLDADEEDVVQEMMVLKQASRSISRVPGGAGAGGGSEGGEGLLEGQMITTSDLNFVIDEVSEK